LDGGPEVLECCGLGEDAAEGEGEEEDGVGDGVVGEALEFVSCEIYAETVEKYGGEGEYDEEVAFGCFWFGERGE
jgi:hypothetical protein